jgi:hypothetical protein
MTFFRFSGRQGGVGGRFFVKKTAEQPGRTPHPRRVQKKTAGPSVYKGENQPRYGSRLGRVKEKLKTLRRYVFVLKAYDNVLKKRGKRQNCKAKREKDIMAI